MPDISMRESRATPDFGPFLPDRDRNHRFCELRILQILVSIFARPWAEPAIAALKAAENNDQALPAALEAFEKLPPLPKRKILSSFAETVK